MSRAKKQTELTETNATDFVLVKSHLTKSIKISAMGNASIENKKSRVAVIYPKNYQVEGHEEGVSRIPKSVWDYAKHQFEGYLKRREIVVVG